MKLKNGLMFICLILFILISVAAVSAVDNNTNIITTNNNEDNNVLSINSSNDEILTAANDGSFADLNTKINGGSSTNIVLDKDYRYSATDTIKDGIAISKNNIEIDGKGHKIDANGKSRIFNITGTTVSLKNIVFANGNHNNGGAIRGYGDNLRIINCTFMDNTAEGYGGAVFSYPDSYTAFVNSTFTNNKAKYGGAISTYNYVGYSGNIDYTNYGTRHDVVNCTFDSNTATDEGGALSIMGQLGNTNRPNDDIANIRGCIFTNNEAPKGEAISNMLSAYINMTDSVIIGNPEKVIYSWGAMFFADYNWWGSTIDNKDVKPNNADGVRFTKWLYFDFNPHIETSSATASINNLYDSQTKETSTYDTSKLPSVNVKFTGVNVTFDKNNAYLDHTGKYEVNYALLGDATLTANCEGIKISKKLKIGGLAQLATLIRNTADDSVIKLDKDYVYIQGVDSPNHRILIQNKHNLVIDGNGYSVNGMGKSRLFALDKDSSDITFKNLNIVNGFSNQDDGNDGPAAYVLAMNTKFINCTFMDNTATGYGGGGALHINAMNVEIDDCRFINNTHKTSAAGAIYFKGENGRITNTLFENNAANSSLAGAIYLYDGGDIEGCTFIHNTAITGGATYNYGSATIDNCTFINNIALADKIQQDDYSYGGAGAVYASDTAITNSRFINNTAVGGSAVVIASLKTSIDRSLFINNTATSPNGIIMGVHEGGKVTNSIFLNNKVAYNSYLISTIWGKLIVDSNWFGNLDKDYVRTPNVSNLAVMSNWIFLNASTPIYDFENNKFKTKFNFYLYDSKTKRIVPFDEDDLPEVNLNLIGENLTLNKNNAFIGDDVNGDMNYRITIGEEGTIFIYEFKGTVTASYENVKYVLPITFQQKTWFEANSTFELMKDEYKYLNFNLQPFEGDYLPFLFKNDRITYKINDTNIISFNKETGKVKGLNVGIATITLTFNGKDVMGRDKYLPSSITILVNVTKAETHIVNVTEMPVQIKVGDMSSAIFGLRDFKNKSLSASQLEYVNNNPSVITLYGAGSSASFKAIGEGTANITVKFSGNKDYLPSSQDFTFLVGRKDPNIRVDPKEIDIKVSNVYLVAVYSESPNDFTYISNDTSVAIMDENGVHGIGAGVAKITVKFEGNERYRPGSDSLIVRVSSVKTHIEVNNTIQMLPTDNLYLNAKIRGSDGKLVGYQVNYVSNDTGVVSVDEYGMLTANGEGKAKITITSDWIGEYEPAKAEVIVNVGMGDSEITVDSYVEVYYKHELNLNAKLNHDGELNYIISNPDVVSVDKYGYIHGKKIGEANITINYEGSPKYKPCTATVKVKVLRAPTKIDVGKTFAWIIGNKGYINANLKPSNNIGHLTFKSNNESVVKVNSWGDVEVIGVGSTTVDISFAGNENYTSSSETVEVAVYASEIPTSIKVNQTFKLFVDEGVNMQAVIDPSNAGKLNYTSSNPDVVSVDEKGTLKAKKAGKATITVSFDGNDVFLSCSTKVNVEVSLIPTTITVETPLTVNLTETASLKYKFSHPQAGELKFIFDDINVASIDHGKVKGDEVGETTLTIKFEGNAKYAPSNATVKITVKDVKTSIDCDDSLDVNVTESNKINAIVNPYTAGKLRYVSNNKDIISVDGNGNVYGIKKGNASVTVIFDGEGKYRASNRTVKVVVTDVQPTIECNDSIDVNVTESAIIDAILTPQNAGKLKFSTENSDIISIDQSGKVKGLKIGTANVTVSFDANGKYRSASKTVTVNVCDVESRIIIENDDIDLVYGDETTIDAKLKPNDSGKLVFTSNDENVVTVDQNGNVKAIKPGVTNITVSYEGEGKYRAAIKNVSVNVVRAPSSIDINDTLNLEIGVGIALHPDTTPKYLKLTYESSDEDVIQMGENGFIFSVGYGTALLNISFAGNDYYLPSNATVTVTVNSRVTEIRVNRTVTIGFGESKNLEAKLISSIGNFTIDGELKYISTNTDIVSVDETGQITAIDVGKAAILISYAGDNIYEPSEAIVDLEVTTRTTSVKVDQPSISLYVDDSQTINASLVNGPEGARLNYISSDPSIVRVNPITGEMTGVSDGNAIVTVAYPGDDDYHSSSANVSVTVNKYKTQVKARTSYEMQVFEDMDLNAAVIPNNGTLTYVSSDEDIVTVSSNGKLTAHKAGTSIVTIKFAGDRKYLPSQKDVIVDVSKIPTSINLTNLKLNTGVEYNLGKVVLPEGVPTKAKYYEYISWDSEIFDVDNGVISTYQKGEAELYVGFLGDDAYLPSNATVKVTVVKNALSEEDYNMTVEVDDDAGEATFTITLPEDAEGNFFVTLNGEVYGEPVVDGKAVIVISELESGDYKANLRYSGDEKYEGVSQNTKFHVGKYKLDKNKDVDVLIGKTAKYTVHLTKDTQAMENKTIKFKVNGKKYYAVTDRLGYASIKVKLPAMKSYKITAQFGSVKVSNKIKVHVIDAKDQKTLKTKNLKVKVALKKVNKKFLVNKKVTLKFNGKTYTGKTNKKGVVYFTIKKSAFSKLKVGKSYKYTVKYSTDKVTKTIKLF